MRMVAMQCRRLIIRDLFLQMCVPSPVIPLQIGICLKQFECQSENPRLLFSCDPITYLLDIYTRYDFLKNFIHSEKIPNSASKGLQLSLLIAYIVLKINAQPVGFSGIVPGTIFSRKSYLLAAVHFVDQCEKRVSHLRLWQNLPVSIDSRRHRQF